MDHILFWAVIALVVLIFWTTWKWLRKLQLRSRRRGNNYLYQEYNYDHDMDYRAIDLAWESHRENIQNNQLVEENFDTDGETAHDSWKDYQDNLSLHEAIEGYLNLELDTDSSKIEEKSEEENLTLPERYQANENFSAVDVDRDCHQHQVHGVRENPEAKDNN